MLDTDLKQIQRKVYISYFQDGLWDILLGVFLIGWGLMIMFDFVAVMGGIWVAIYFLVLGLKRWLTYPRAGYIKIPEARRQQMKMIILGAVLFLLGFMVFLITSTSNRPEWFSEYFMFIFGTMFSVITVILAYWWKVSRWYAYAGLIFISFCTHQWLNAPLNLSFMVPGGIIMLFGLYLLVLFLRKYSKSAQDVVNADQ